MKQWLDVVINDTEVIIKRKDNKDVVLISLEEYNSLRATNYFLSGKNRDVLLNSLKEAADNKTESHILIEK